MRTVESIRPMPGWALCEMLRPVAETKSGLIMGRALEDGKTTEAVARVHRVTPAEGKHGPIDPGFTVGDNILIRDFLKYANTVGELVGADRADRFFLLNNKDALAVVSGPGTLGFYGEFVLE